MQNSLISIKTLQGKAEKGACLDCGGFISHLPVFLNYSPLLDTQDITISATMKTIWGNEVEGYLSKAKEIGVLLETNQSGLYLYAPYFAEQTETRNFQRLDELKSVAAPFDLDPRGLWIVKSNGTGNLISFLTIVARYLFGSVKGEGKKKNPIHFACIDWQVKQQEAKAKGLEEGLGNSNGSGKSNCSGNSVGNGESNAVTITPKEIPNDKESRESEILNDWAAQCARPVGELITYFRNIYWGEKSKPAKEEIESLLNKIPQTQCPKKFEILFKDVLNPTQEEPPNHANNEDWGGDTPF